MAQSLPIPFLWKLLRQSLCTSESPIPECGGFNIHLIDQLASDQQMSKWKWNPEIASVSNRLTIDYLGLEVDDLLIDLSASIADVMEASVVFAQGDGSPTSVENWLR